MSSGSAIYPSLHGRGVLISGGAAGIGAAMVQRFVEQGARVGFIDLDEAGAARTVADAAPRGEAPVFACCDLRDATALRAAIAAIRKAIGPIRVLVNNAARDLRRPLADMSVEEWDDQMAVNLRHHFLAAQAVAPDMAANGGGAIINMGSIAWMKNSAGLPAYVAAKAAIGGLTKGLARELGPAAIRVNCVVPGWVWTERQAGLWGTPGQLAAIMERQCLKEIVQPDDVANLVLWLAADDSRMCTAQNFIIDAGVM